MAHCWWIIFASWLSLPRYVDSDSDRHPTIVCPIVLPNLSQFIIIIIIIAAAVIILHSFVTGHCAVKLAL